jgi:hypothetical protein
MNFWNLLLLKRSLFSWKVEELMKGSTMGAVALGMYAILRLGSSLILQI